MNIRNVTDIHGVFSGIEVGVMFNSNRELVLCNEHDNRDDPDNTFLQELIDFEESLTIVLDIKARGVMIAYELADAIYENIQNSIHNWRLCSLNEMCVNRLLRLGCQNVGIVTSGLSLQLYTQMDIDFVSIDYEIAGADILNTLRALDIEIYIWGIKRVRPELQADAYIISNSGSAVSNWSPNVSHNTHGTDGVSPTL
tara:strand:+ start:437 stop:1030 length:594 start_codon:yes stop_codon:yes gene_type:complete